MPKLSRPHSSPSRPRFPLKLSDILVVRDILEVFLEVLPCFHMTVLSSSWVSWFSESLFSPRIYTGYPGLVGWAKATTWRVERQKLYLTLFLLKGLSLSCWSKIVLPLWIYYLPNLWFEFGLSPNQTRSQGLSWWCSTWGFHLSTSLFLLVWPILLPCSYNIWVHLLGASK
jgi:hypothetical protein